MVIATREQAGKVVEARVGGEVVVLLDENPTTGFVWVLRSDERPVLLFRESDFEPAAKAGLGTGGKRLFRFQPREAGVVTLEFDLRREWEEKTAPPIDHVSFEVKVVP